MTSQHDSLSEPFVFNQEEKELLLRLVDYHIAVLKENGKELRHTCLVDYYIKLAQKVKEKLSN